MKHSLTFALSVVVVCYQNYQSKHQIQGSYDEFLAFLSKKPASDDGQLKINGGCSSEGQNKTSDMLIPAASTGRCPFLHGTGESVVFVYYERENNILKTSSR